MIAAPIPAGEASRVAALEELEILDTEGEAAYDAIVEVASALCEVPMSLVTLVDPTRNWFKATVGFPDAASRAVPREISFCAHAILEEDGLTVEDASRDERFHDNPLVSDGPGIRFYAGRRLLTPSGHAVGALCVVDKEPRVLTARQQAGLEALALQVAQLFELRLNNRLLREEVEERASAERRAMRACLLANQARMAADEANRAKSTFLARMSHELRTPLNAIIGFSRVVGRNRRGTLDASESQFVARIEANGHHLLRLVNDVLDLSRLESTAETAVLAPEDARALVQATVDEMQGRVIESDNPGAVQLRTELPPVLAPLLCDALRLKQILINLIGNALKFTHAGEVVVRAVAGPGDVLQRIEVADTGIGIPPDRLEAVFKPFEQASEETARSYGGTGLGLAISRSLADLLGYGIVVRSSVGEGTVFSVHLNPESEPVEGLLVCPAASGPFTEPQRPALLAG